ncbi:hypothetical protein K439DRAFT_1329713 [Ramaria rubella]|nr:hypothetical protein K439DRAFT_1329713 [Ramaria rubella]
MVSGTHPSCSDIFEPLPPDAVVKPDKPTDYPPHAELKNGKVIFKQKPISFDHLSETMQEIVSFRSYIDASDGPLGIIPDMHLPLIAKLVHESDKSVTALAKALQLLLTPPTLDPSHISGTGAHYPISLSVIELAIKAVADRVNYGIQTQSDKHPAALCVWRWEAKDKNWLPTSVKEKVHERYQERIAARERLQVLFEALPDSERRAMLQTGKNSKSLKGRELSAGADIKSFTLVDVNVQASGSQDLTVTKPGRPKKTVDAEAVAKDKERQEKKAIKAEKEKREAEATKKSAAVFANFFKPGTLRKPSDLLKPQSPVSTSASAAGELNEFHQIFKPFAVKKDAHLAPFNWFLDQKEGARHGRKGKEKDRRDVIILDDEGRGVQSTSDDEVTPMDVETKEIDVSHLSAHGLLLRSFVESQPISLHPISCTLVARRRFKTEPQYCVRAIMHQINDAEIQGDQRAVRKLTALLRDRRKIPVKVLIFAENNRPGYLGTWTRGSPMVTPRTPFQRNLLCFDYDHDSDAEWEEETAEGEVDDVDSLNGSLEDDVSTVGSDMADWLVEGDEMDLEQLPIQDNFNLPPRISSVKRKSTGSHEAHSKKRKIVPLVPFQKGPIWEKEAGVCGYEPFKPMRIQLFNDTPFPIDPFTFRADPLVLEKVITSNPRSKDTDGVFVLPALPGHILPTAPLINDSSMDEFRVKRKAANSTPLPRTSFPDAHIPLLLQKIGASTTNSFAVLLDSLFHDMKPLGIKKNALEVKLREVTEKDKVTKEWVTKQDAWVSTFKQGVTQC